MDELLCYSCQANLNGEDHYIYNDHRFCENCLMQELEADGKITIRDDEYMIPDYGNWIHDPRKVARFFPEVTEVVSDDF